MQDILTIDQIDQEIALLQKKLRQVKGTKTEVYTRIVGYHRAVDNWNNGKKEEYKSRTTFKFNQDDINQMSMFKKQKKKRQIKEEKPNKQIDTNKVVFYKFFTSQYCRNCTPVKDYIKNLPVVGEEVDVSTDLGINASRKYNILSTPTVVLFDDDDNIIDKVYSVEELETLFN